MNNNVNVSSIVEKFNISGNVISTEICNIGHINNTYFVTTSDNEYVLQNINTNIFKKPDEVMANIIGVTEFLKGKIKARGGDTTRETLTVVNTKEGDKPLYIDENGSAWRVYYRIKNAKSYDAIENVYMFYLTGKSFGEFQRLLADYPAETLYETIPNFHNTKSRYNDFLTALEKNAAGRAESVAAEIEFVKSRYETCCSIVDKIANGTLSLCVTHNDTKLNNIMFDKDTNSPICVLDLDTVMPGSVLYDFGDAIRFGASSAAEDETDLSLVYIKTDFFDEFAKGFIEGVGGALSKEEILSLPLGAVVITLETGIRFLTDHLNGDVYFRVHRENHNLDRARNQFKLVSDMENKMNELTDIVKKYI